MIGRAKEGTALVALVKLAIPLCQQAEHACPRTGPGRKPVIPDWVMAVLIIVAVLKQRKTKSAQYRYLRTQRTPLLTCLGTDRFPSRSTYFDRYRRACICTNTPFTSPETVRCVVDWLRRNRWRSTKVWSAHGDRVGISGSGSETIAPRR